MTSLSTSWAASRKKRRAGLAWSLAAMRVSCCLAPAFAGAAQAPPEPPGSVDLTELSMEELMDTEVTSVSRRAEPVSAAAAAIYVITSDDLRRSGATSIPEALRMVPGLEVARIDANKWAISARGFNGRFANKLLVLIDGRSVYTSLFSGVFWDVQDTLLEDVDRIEVIRGPGATLWGANAVNGVINIITKPARETAGGLVTAGGGSQEQGFLGLRYGSSRGSSDYRVYAKAFERNGGDELTGETDADRWSMARGGFRIDRDLPEGSSLTLQGDLYEGEVGETLTLTRLGASGFPRSETLATESRVSGGHLLGRWRRAFSDASDLVLQLFYDRASRNATILDEDRDVLDLELQHGLAPGDRHKVVWGLGLRRTSDDIVSSDVLSFDPGRRTDDLASGFFQDEIALVSDRLWLTLGTKLEHNDYTGFEVQPNIRAVWMPRHHHTLWAAVSRAVRTPSRAEHDFRFQAQALGPGQLAPAAPPAVVVSAGDPRFRSEDLVAWELGYRAGAAPGLFLDIATFYNVYDDLRTVRTGEPRLDLGPPLPHLVIPARVSNDMEGETWGFELAGDWRASERWRLGASYGFLETDLRLDRGSDDVASLAAAEQSPRHQVHLRAAADLSRNLEATLLVHAVDRLPGTSADGYTGLDLHLAWKPRPGLELSLVGQNLLEESRLEFTPDVIPTHATGTERGGYGKVTWRF